MPPKKNKAIKQRKEDPLTILDEKYRKALDEIEALKDILAQRKQLSGKAVQQNVESKQVVQELKQKLQEQAQEKKDIVADMTRQFKALQAEMGFRIAYLEEELNTLSVELQEANETLQRVEEENRKINMEKDIEIEKQKRKISTLEKEYQRILLESFTSLLDKVDEERKKWEKEVTFIQAKHKKNFLKSSHYSFFF